MQVSTTLEKIALFPPMVRVTSPTDGWMAPPTCAGTSFPDRWMGLRISPTSAPEHTLNVNDDGLTWSCLESRYG